MSCAATWALNMLDEARFPIFGAILPTPTPPSHTAMPLYTREPMHELRRGAGKLLCEAISPGASECILSLSNILRHEIAKMTPATHPARSIVILTLAGNPSSGSDSGPCNNLSLKLFFGCLKGVTCNKGPKSMTVGLRHCDADSIATPSHVHNDNVTQKRRKC